MFYVELNMDGLKPLFSSLSKKELRRVMIRAIKLAARKTKTRSVDIAAREYALKKAELRKRIFVKPEFGSGDDLQAKVIFQFRAIPLRRFKAKQTSKGVGVKVMRGERRIVIKHAFIADSKAARNIVFIRKEAVSTDTQNRFVKKLPRDTMKRSAKGSALPIVGLVEKRGLSEVMAPHAPALREYAAEVGLKELERQISLLLGS